MQSIPQFQNLVEMAQYRAEISGSTQYAEFIKDNGDVEDKITFTELCEDAKKIASALVNKGLAGRNLLLLFPSGIDYIRAFFGCLYAGAIPVPAYPPMGAKDLTRLQNIAQDCNAGAILSNHGLNPMIENWTSQLGYSDRLASFAIEAFLKQQAVDFQPHQAKAEDTAFLQYTSGSTGHPKGVEVSHGNLIANFQQIIHGFLEGNPAFADIEQLKAVIWLPPFHDMGLIGGVLTPIYYGVNVTLMAPLTFLKRPFLWLKTLSEKQAHISGGPNFCYQYCVRKISEEKAAQLDLSNWQLAFNGAEPIQASALTAFSERFQHSGFNPDAFLPCYGLAEASLFVAGSPSGRGVKTLSADLQALANGQFEPGHSPEKSTALVSSGVLAKGTDVRIVNPRTATQCNDNEVGEIWISGPSVAKGYWNKPQFSKSVFQAMIQGEEQQGDDQKTFLRSGDLGFFHNGELFVSGRTKEVIILAGRNHYPQDIEQTLQQANPSFKAGGGAAVSISENGKEQLVILQEVSRAAGKQADFKLLASTAVKAISARHGVTPSALVLLSGSVIPKTSSGKIQRAEAKQLYQNGNFVPVYVWQPKTGNQIPTQSLIATKEEAHYDCLEELQGEVQQWVADKLDVETHHVDLDVTFAELGVDSVESVELVDQLQSRIGRVIPATELLRYPTVKALIEHFAEEMEHKAMNKLELEPAEE